MHGRTTTAPLTTRLKVAKANLQVHPSTLSEQDQRKIRIADYAISRAQSLSDEHGSLPRTVWIPDEVLSSRS